MKTPRACVVLLSCALAVSLHAAADPAWPELTRENKPWTRWWWPGSAVDPASLTADLEQFATAGLGGVEITPIYGARGYESRTIPYLSPKWMQMLEHTGREASRLGLGVDMATGTGWPFGGPWVAPLDGSMKLVSEDGRLAGAPTKMMVKRAAPGAEGLVVDPYSPAALARYLAPFSAAFADFPAGLVRGQFHDSFEYYNSEWTPELPVAFQQQHGYDLNDFAAELLGQKPADADTLARVRSDYRETIAQLHLGYLNTWVKWSHDHGFKVRNQSHGAPANLLDLYGAVDMAETETFGSTPFPIPGLRRQDDEVRHGQDLPEPLVMRMASSAGHVMGHALTSSETCTWLREHWKVSLAYTKPEIDRLFVNGINHLFYHGTVFSPQDAPWPGWLFYASTQFNPRNTWWNDFSALNTYVGRAQSLLQRGAPDNEILIYWPAADVWDATTGPLMQQLGVHDVKWLTEKPTGRLALKLLNTGYGFDYISDAQLQQTRAEAGQLVTPGARYRVLLVPAARRMSVATLQRLADLARDGAHVLFEALPEDVPGYGRLEARRAEFAAIRATLAGLVSADLPAALPKLGVAREPIADTGVSFIRRQFEDGHVYFLANQTGRAVEGWVWLGRAAGAVLLMNPLNGNVDVAAFRQRDGAAEVFVQIAPGESFLLKTAAPSHAFLGDPLRPTRPHGKPVTLDGDW
ncbi:MAG: glycosyl hydrolase, partial [Lacunisphaera sp.]|nr:glycosyl hydrolase [Lacunisphaera sp.]